MRGCLVDEPLPPHLSGRESTSFDERADSAWRHLLAFGELRNTFLSHIQKCTDIGIDV